MKRIWLFTMAVAALMLAGCQDHPSEGVVDTRVVREVANIEEITGKAYGLKESAPKALKALNADERILDRAGNLSWNHVMENGSLEGLDLQLTYPGVDADKMNGLLAQLADTSLSVYKKTLASIDADIAEAKAALGNAKAEFEKLDSKDAAFKAAVAEEQKAYDNAKAEMNEAREKVQGIYQDAATDMSKLAERLGFTGRRSLKFDEDLIAEYKVLDYTGRNDLPKDCPPQRNHEAVDIRDLTNQCAYLHMGTIWFRDPAVEKDARKILNTNFRELSELMQVIGDDGRRSGEKTGLYAKIDDRKSKLEAAYAEAAKTHGNKQERERTLAKLDRKIQDLEAKIEKLNSEDYREEKLYRADVNFPEGYWDAVEDYMKDGMADLFENHIVAVSDISLDPDAEKKDGHFENVGSDFVELASVSDILASNRYSKDVVRAFNHVSLTSPEVTEADVIKVEVTPENLKQRGRNDSIEKLQEDLVKYLSDVYKDRKVS